MTVIDLFGELSARIGEGQVSVGVHIDVTAAAQESHGVADGRLAEAHVFPHINRTDIRAFPGQNQNGLQIHFPRFLYFHD